LGRCYLVIGRLKRVHDFTVSVAELLGKPGEYRDITIREPLEGVQSALGRMTADRIHAPLRLESVMEGILVTGRVEAASSLQCARCLIEFPSSLHAEVCELYVVPAAVGADVDDTYKVAGAEVNLEPMLRDALTLALPLRPLCREGCKGICARCGADLNSASCACVEDSTDARWAPLEGLKEKLREQAEPPGARSVPQG
jgi:DUF177 domain-containing protein